VAVATGCLAKLQAVILQGLWWDTRNILRGFRAPGHLGNEHRALA